MSKPRLFHLRRQPSTPPSNMTRVVFDLRATCDICKRKDVPAHYVTHGYYGMHLIVCALCTMTGQESSSHV